MTMAIVLWLVMGAALVAYTVTGGADYGGGVWDLLARGPSRASVRAAIERAIAPIWEANHVWLIFLVVTAFTVFPKAFAVTTTALNIPITLALIGMVLRGASFVLRAYGMETAQRRAAWGVAFGVSSVLTPVLLGLTLAGVASGRIRVDDAGNVVTGFFAGWLTPFAFTVGAFALSLFMLLAAVYLAYDTEGETRAYFRRRGIVMEGVTGAVSLIVLWRARADAPLLFEGLLGSSQGDSHWAALAQGLVLILAIAVVVALVRGAFGIARILAAVQVALIVAGFGFAMDGHLVLPDVSVTDAGARIEVMGALLPALIVGSLIVVPSLWLLFRIFKTHRDERPSSERER